MVDELFSCHLAGMIWLDLQKELRTIEDFFLHIAYCFFSISRSTTSAVDGALAILLLYNAFLQTKL